MFTSQPVHNQNLSNFLVVYFQFAYSLYCSPFRILSKRNGPTSVRFALKENVIQKIVFRILQTLTILFIITFFKNRYRRISYGRNLDPSEYRNIIGDSLLDIGTLLVVKKFICSRHQYLDIVNCIQDKFTNWSFGTIRIQRKFVVFLICLLFTLIGIVEGAGIICVGRSGDWEIGNIFSRRWIFFVKKSLFLPTSAPKSPVFLNSTWIMDYAVGVLGAFVTFHYLLFKYYFFLLFLMAVLTMWTAASQFSKKIQNDMNSNTGDPVSTVSVEAKWQDIYQEYQNIRELCHLVNKAFGTIVFAYLGSTIAILSKGLEEVFLAYSNVERIILLFYVASSTVTFLLAADVCHKLDILCDWLAIDKNRKNVPADELNIVMGELQRHHVGIKANGIFTITYGNIWNVFAVAVAFFILCLQSRQLT